MQTPATLVDFVSFWDIATFFAVPLFLIVAAFLQEYFEWKVSPSHHHSDRPISP